MADRILPSGKVVRTRLTHTGVGRQKGSLNRSTLLIKEAIQAVYRDLQDEAGGGNSHFATWAKEHPTEFYKMAARLLPLEIRAQVQAGVVGAVIFKGLNDQTD